MPKPTSEEITNLLMKVVDTRRTIPQFSAFGDENWDRLDRQIELLHSAVEENDVDSDDFIDDEDDGVYACAQFLDGTDKTYYNDWMEG